MRPTRASKTAARLLKETTNTNWASLSLVAESPFGCLRDPWLLSEEDALKSTTSPASLYSSPPVANRWGGPHLD